MGETKFSLKSASKWEIQVLFCALRQEVLPELRDYASDSKCPKEIKNLLENSAFLKTIEDTEVKENLDSPTSAENALLIKAMRDTLNAFLPALKEPKEKMPNALRTKASVMLLMPVELKTLFGKHK